MKLINIFIVSLMLFSTTVYPLATKSLSKEETQALARVAERKRLEELRAETRANITQLNENQEILHKEVRAYLDRALGSYYTGISIRDLENYQISGSILQKMQTLGVDVALVDNLAGIAMHEIVHGHPCIMIDKSSLEHFSSDSVNYMLLHELYRIQYEQENNVPENPAEVAVRSLHHTLALLTETELDSLIRDFRDYSSQEGIRHEINSPFIELLEKYRDSLHTYRTNDVLDDQITTHILAALAALAPTSQLTNMPHINQKLNEKINKLRDLCQKNLARLQALQQSYSTGVTANVLLANETVDEHGHLIETPGMNEAKEEVVLTDIQESLPDVEVESLIAPDLGIAKEKIIVRVLPKGYNPTYHISNKIMGEQRVILLSAELHEFLLNGAKAPDTMTATRLFFEVLLKEEMYELTHGMNKPLLVQQDDKHVLNMDRVEDEILSTSHAWQGISLEQLKMIKSRFEQFAPPDIREPGEKGIKNQNLLQYLYMLDQMEEQLKTTPDQIITPTLNFDSIIRTNLTLMYNA